MSDLPFAPEFVKATDDMIATFDMEKGGERDAVRDEIMANATLQGLDAELIAACANATKYPSALKLAKNRAAVKWLDFNADRTGSA